MFNYFGGSRGLLQGLFVPKSACHLGNYVVGLIWLVSGRMRSKTRLNERGRDGPDLSLPLFARPLWYPVSRFSLKFVKIRIRLVLQESTGWLDFDPNFPLFSPVFLTLPLLRPTSLVSVSAVCFFPWMLLIFKGARERRRVFRGSFCRIVLVVVGWAERRARERRFQLRFSCFEPRLMRDLARYHQFAWEHLWWRVGTSSSEIDSEWHSRRTTQLLQTLCKLITRFCC